MRLDFADMTVAEEFRGKRVLSDLLLGAEFAARAMSLQAVYAENVRVELGNPISKRGYRVWMRGGLESPQYDMLKEV